MNKKRGFREQVSITSKILSEKTSDPPIEIKSEYGTTRIYEKSWRSFLKSFSWRITATATTILIAWLILDDVTQALEIGGIEFFLKMAIYYFHERIWSRLKIGQVIEKKPPPDYQI